MSGEVQTFEDRRFDFRDTKTVVVTNELYAFKEGLEVSAYKIANFFSNDHLVITALSSLFYG